MWGRHYRILLLKVVFLIVLLFDHFGGIAQQWEYITRCRPWCAHVSQFVHQNLILISAVNHACYLMRAIPGSDPDSVLSHPDTAGATSDADEFHSCVSGSTGAGED